MREAVQAETASQSGTPIATSIDGATAVVFCEFGLWPPHPRGPFCLSRPAGVPVHGWEQMQQGGRNREPMSPEILPAYEETNTDE